LANILIVEDDCEIAETVAELLTPAGHVTRTAANGLEGLRMIADRVPDLILLDVEMPILDGPGMVKALAGQHDGQPRIPIVVVSAAGNIRDIAGRIGTPHYVKKPFSLGRLLELVTLALALRRR
jgi:DNA-binding response OmpR family regulator